MKLDSPEDRSVLLQLIQSSTVPGGAVPIVADLIQRIQNAEIESGQDAVKSRTKTEKPNENKDV